MSDQNQNNIGETLGNVAKTMGEAANSVSKAMGEATGSMAQQMGEATGNVIQTAANVGQNLGQSVGLLDNDNEEDAAQEVVITAEGTGTLHTEGSAPSAEGSAC